MNIKLGEELKIDEIDKDDKAEMDRIISLKANKYRSFLRDHFA